MAEQRIVQTGIEFERMVRREEVVMGVGQAQFTGLYQAPIVQIDAPKPVPSGTVISGTVPMATACVTGVDLNHDGIPDVLQGGAVQAGVFTAGVQQTTYVGEPMAQVGMVTGAAPMATAIVDANRNGRYGDAGDLVVTGIDRNRDGIPDVLQAPPRGVQYVQGGVTTGIVGGYSAVAGGVQVCGGAVVGSSVPMAAVGVDVNRDGIADYTYVGADRNHDGIPDALQGGYTVVGAAPMATACVTGVDMNRDGIPDALQRGYPVVGAAPMATACVSGVDMNRDGIPDVLQQPRYV